MERIKFYVVLFLSISTRVGLHAGIPVSEVSEGACLSDPPQVKFDFDWMLEFVIYAKYTPIASKSYFYLLHIMLTGSPPSDFSEFDQMCLITEAGLSLTMHAYKNKYQKLSCDVLSLSSLNCYPPEEPANGTTLTMTWTHDKRYVIFTICSVEKLKGWSLMAKEKEIPDDVKEKALKHVKEIGFDPTYAMKMNYKNCKV